MANFSYRGIKRFILFDWQTFHTVWYDAPRAGEVDTRSLSARSEKSQHGGFGWEQDPIID